MLSLTHLPKSSHVSLAGQSEELWFHLEITGVTTTQGRLLRVLSRICYSSSEPLGT